MLRVSELGAFLDLPLNVEAILRGPSLRIAELLALRHGTVLRTMLPAGANVEVTAGDAIIGAGELTVSGGRLAVRMLGFREKE